MPGPLWLWPPGPGEAFQLPRPPGWPEPLQGFCAFARSLVWEGQWWKLTEVYLLACYWHIALDNKGSLLDDSLDGRDAYDKWDMAIEALLVHRVLRTVDGYPKRALQVVH